MAPGLAPAAARCALQRGRRIWSHRRHQIGFRKPLAVVEPRARSDACWLRPDANSWDCSCLDRDAGRSGLQPLRLTGPSSPMRLTVGSSATPDAVSAKLSPGQVDSAAPFTESHRSRISFRRLRLQDPIAFGIALALVLALSRPLADASCHADAEKRPCEISRVRAPAHVGGEEDLSAQATCSTDPVPAQGALPTNARLVTITGSLPRLCAPHRALQR